MANTDDNSPASGGDGEDFASLLAEFEGGRNPHKRVRGPQLGDMVKGRIVSIGHEAIFVDLGGKAEGALDALEFKDERGEFSVNVGDVVEARVVSTNDGTGMIALRKALGGGRGPEARAELEQAAQHGIPVEGVVTAVNKGGVEVQIAGARAFCPISQLDLRHVEDASTFVGQRLAFRITRYEAGTKGRENIVVSRRALLEVEQRSQAVKTREQLKIGAVLKGTVSSLKDYGAFIDLGGIEGMLHVSELGFHRVSHPKDMLSVGQTVEVQVIRLEKSEDPRRSEKISLSLKALEKDPWADAMVRFPEGARLTGKVMRVEQFGAFVEVAPGIEGLVHISEFGGGSQVKHTRQVAKVGEAIQVRVMGVDQERRRIAFALAASTGDGDDETGASQGAGKAPVKLGTFADLLSGAGGVRKRVK